MSGVIANGIVLTNFGGEDFGTCVAIDARAILLKNSHP